MDEREKKPEVFRYTYSAQQQKKVEQIRAQYLPREEEGKLEQLERLDRRVRRPGRVISLTLGTVSTLVMGTGMSLILVWEYWVPGLLTGVLGLVGICVSYPVYRAVGRRQRAKYGPEILRLSNELMGDE